MVEIVDARINESAVLESVKSDLAGANVLFVGTTRSVTDGRETVTLNYEAYAEMAIKQIDRLLTTASEKWRIVKCSVVHRTGEVPVGEASVAVAVSSAHRAASFESAAWIMEQLKRRVPIWKQEIWADGSQEWVHPDENPQQIKSD